MGITLFCTFFCRHCATTTWKCLISHFVENVNSRQHFYVSSPELWYSLLEFNSLNKCQHLMNWTRWNKRDKVWSSATSLLIKVAFSLPFRRRRCYLIRTLRNYDDDGNRNVQKAIGLMSKTTTLHVHHAFLYISLLFLHNYDVKWPHVKFTWEPERQGYNF